MSRQKLTSKLLDNLESEINILKVISNRNIVALIDCFVSPPLLLQPFLNSVVLLCLSRLLDLQQDSRLAGQIGSVLLLIRHDDMIFRSSTYMPRQHTQS